MMGKVKRGKTCYIPKIVINDLYDLMREDEIDRRDKKEGFRMMAKYARVGREVNRMRKLDFGRKANLPPIVEKDKKKNGRPKSGLRGLF